MLAEREHWKQYGTISPSGWTLSSLEHTDTPAGAGKRARRPAARFQGSCRALSPHGRTLRAVSGSWSDGMPVSLRLQADPLEGQVKYFGPAADGTARRPL